MDAEDALFGRGVFGAHSSNPAMSIIGAEDEDFENDLNDVGDDQCKYFSSIDQLKDHPAHLLAFIQHVILQFDPAPLLCYLHGELLKNLSAKETKKQFVEFNNNFLDKGAVSSPLHNMHYRTRPELLPEETQRRYVHEVQSLQCGEVAKQLEDFRTKRMMGMTPCEAELNDVESHYPTDRIPMEMKEKSVAENLLDRMAESQPTIVSDEEKCQSIFAAVAFYMKHLGVKTRAVDSKKSRGGFFRIPLGKLKPSSLNQMKVPLLSILGFLEDEENALLTDLLLPNLSPVVNLLIHYGRAGWTSDCQTVWNVSKMYVLLLSYVTVIFISLYFFLYFLPGHLMNRLETPTVSDGGDLSPVGLGGGLSIVEPLSSSDTPTEEILVADGQGASPTSPSPQLEEVEPRLLEFEQDPPNWRELASSDALSCLSKKDIKRQEVINGEAKSKSDLM
uniref:Regulator of G protein signalling-like domain-containing protein n=1 Tax=Periophthalmus magnuspinnatus TaxID=409849 RepID=A0A3B4B0M6_9GOBI